MSDARAAVGFDRLPWLPDEVPAEARTGRNWRALIGWVLGGALVIGAGGYWFGYRPATEQPPPTVTHTVPPAENLPAPAPEIAQPQAEPDPLPAVEPVPVPAVSAPEPATKIQRKARKSRKRNAVVVHRNATPPSIKPSKETASVAASPAKGSSYPVLWPSRVTKGASGRVVQIGAFGSRYQAKRGWWAMVRAYPALKRLPAVVNDARNSKGRRFYRLQIGTTSQAHSEVLCQKMRRIDYSCAVVGLPGERKAVER